MEQPIFQTDAGKSLAGGRQEERWTELCLDDQSRLDVGYNAALPSGQSVSQSVSQSCCEDARSENFSQVALRGSVFGLETVN